MVMLVDVPLVLRGQQEPLQSCSSLSFLRALAQMLHVLRLLQPRMSRTWQAHCNAVLEDMFYPWVHRSVKKGIRADMPRG